MTRQTREQRRHDNSVSAHGPFATLRGFVANFIRLAAARKADGITVLTFAKWRAKKWGGPCHSPANAEERFGYRIYLDQMSKVNDEPADQQG